MDIDQAPLPDSDVAAAPLSDAAPVGVLTADEADDLLERARAARENNVSGSLTDSANRSWFVGTDTVANQTTVLIQVRLGERERHANISTAVFTDDAVSSAISALDAALAS